MSYEVPVVLNCYPHSPVCYSLGHEELPSASKGPDPARSEVSVAAVQMGDNGPSRTRNMSTVMVANLSLEHVPCARGL